MDKRLFKHKTAVAVRNYEIDWQGIVHNAIYLHYFEIGRIEYLNRIGAQVDINSINNNAKVVLARNEIDYVAPARYGDTLIVHSRISSIRNSSFIFEAIIERDKTKEVIAENVAVHVWLHPHNNASMQVPDDFRKIVQRYEGKHCQIHWPTITV